MEDYKLEESIGKDILGLRIFKREKRIKNMYKKIEIRNNNKCVNRERKGKSLH